MENKRFIVTGIGTDIGKTVVSAILAEAFEAYYWKPVQAGELNYSDSDKISEWTNDKVKILPEVFRLTQGMSPHAAALFDGVSISEDFLKLPEVNGNLIIEGAGGLMVPLNNEGLRTIELLKNLNLTCIFGHRNYI